MYLIFDPRLRSRQSVAGRKSLRRNTNAGLNVSNINNNEEDEEQMQVNKGKNRPSKFVGIFKNIRKKIGTKYVDSFARFKDDKVLVRDIVICFLMIVKT